MQSYCHFACTIPRGIFCDTRDLQCKSRIACSAPPNKFFLYTRFVLRESYRVYSFMLGLLCYTRFTQQVSFRVYEATWEIYVYTRNHFARSFRVFCISQQSFPVHAICCVSVVLRVLFYCCIFMLHAVCTIQAISRVMHLTTIFPYTRENLFSDFSACFGKSCVLS